MRHSNPLLFIYISGVWDGGGGGGGDGGGGGGESF